MHNDCGSDLVICQGMRKLVKKRKDGLVDLTKDEEGHLRNNDKVVALLLVSMHGVRMESCHCRGNDVAVEIMENVKLRCAPQDLKAAISALIKTKLDK
jgi:hypothetical protein